MAKSMVGLLALLLALPTPFCSCVGTEGSRTENFPESRALVASQGLGAARAIIKERLQAARRKQQEIKEKARKKAMSKALLNGKSLRILFNLCVLVLGLLIWSCGWLKKKFGKGEDANEGEE